MFPVIYSYTSILFYLDICSFNLYMFPEQHITFYSGAWKCIYMIMPLICSLFISAQSLEKNLYDYAAHMFPVHFCSEAWKCIYMIKPLICSLLIQGTFISWMSTYPDLTFMFPVNSGNIYKLNEQISRFNISGNIWAV